MITKIEALNYRAFRRVSQNLQPFQVLIGPNGSGKSTFLDMIVFLSEVIAGENVEAIVARRSENFFDLTWMKQQTDFSLAVEVTAPDAHFRYELRVGIGKKGLQILNENLWLVPADVSAQEIITTDAPDGWKELLFRNAEEDYSAAEKTSVRFFMNRQTSGLSFIPSLISGEEAGQLFPLVLWFKAFMGEKVQRIMLDVAALRSPYKGIKRDRLQADGGNLPAVIQQLQQTHPEQFRDWLMHVQVALPEIESIRVFERPEDGSRYLLVKYKSGLEVPSWVVSDGTLRLLALTALAYTPVSEGVYLIEEPEDGIHPHDIEILYQPLNYVYNSQILIVTHSTAVISLVKSSHLLFFNKAMNEGVTITPANQHYLLQHWHEGDVSLAALFAGGAFS